MYTERDSTGRMKLLFEAWHGDLDRRKNEKEWRRERNIEGTKERKAGKKRTPMTVKFEVSGSVCISHWGLASGSRSRLTDGAFNWLHRIGTNGGQSSEELMQNNRGLLFPTEGPPLDQIMDQAVDIYLPSILSAEGRLYHTPIQMFVQLASLSFLLSIYLLPESFS